MIIKSQLKHDQNVRDQIDYRLLNVSSVSLLRSVHALPYRQLRRLDSVLYAQLADLIAHHDLSDSLVYTKWLRTYT